MVTRNCLVQIWVGGGGGGLGGGRTNLGTNQSTSNNYCKSRSSLFMPALGDAKKTSPLQCISPKKERLKQEESKIIQVTSVTS